MGAPLTGKDATFKQGGVALDVDVVGWTFDPKENEVRFASDKTSGHKVGYGSVKDFDAGVTVVMPLTGALPFGVGSTFVAQFHGDDSGNNYIQATVEVTGVPLVGDINEGQDVERTYALMPRGPAVYFGLYWWGAGSSGN